MVTTVGGRDMRQLVLTQRIIVLPSRRTVDNWQDSIHQAFFLLGDENHSLLQKKDFAQ